VLPKSRRLSGADSRRVVSHYNEELEVMADTIKQVTDRLKGSTRVIIYSKGERDQAGLDELLQYADEVVPLPNIGREGETYLVSLMITIEVEP
jgi:hypothetical protein